VLTTLLLSLIEELENLLLSWKRMVELLTWNRLDALTLTFARPVFRMRGI